jgi:hypothetical protein
MSEKVDAVVPLFIPPLEELCKVLQNALSKQFSEAAVEIVDCPNLTAPPFYLAAPGFGGSPKLVDVGGVPNLAPIVNKNKIYDLAKVTKACKSPNAFVIGPGAGPFHELGKNSEMMANIYFGDSSPKIGTHLAWIGDNDSYVSEPWTKSAQFALMGNFLLTDGKPGTPVVKVRAKLRTGKDDFVTCMRNGLAAKYGDKPIGIGGVFLIKTGQANLHVMPDFSKEPLEKEADVNNWLRYFDMDAPLVCLSVFYSHDPGLALRIDHTHCFSQHGQGGHYHYDVTPDTVEYEGYFTLAEHVYRVDKP